MRIRHKSAGPVRLEMVRGQGYELRQMTSRSWLAIRSPKMAYDDFGRIWRDEALFSLIGDVLAY